MITSVDEFVRLRSSEDPEDYRRAALEPASVEVWHEVLREHPEMAQWVAHNKTGPLTVLETLAEDLDERIRFTVAMKNKLTPELFQKLATDPSEGVRTRIAYNRNAPVAILERLKDDPCQGVAEAARSRLGMSHLKTMFQAAFIAPYASHRWASARGRSHWVILKSGRIRWPVPFPLLSSLAAANTSILAMISTSQVSMSRSR